MSNMTFSVIGAGVGYMFFGPYGAQLGWMLGSAVDSSKQVIDQKRVGDLKVMTSQYGESIPYIIGVNRVAPNVIWSSEKKPYTIKTKQGKGGPTVETTGYKIDMLLCLGVGPILGVSKVWANEKLIVDASVDAKPLPGTLYLGNMSQLPDPTYEAAVGVGNAPAYRGLALMSLHNFDLQAYGGTVPSLSFEVVRGATL